MLYFLYGPDTYRSQRKLREIIIHYQKIHSSGLNLKYFDAKQSSFQEFKDIFQTVSMFKEKKLIVLTNSFTNPDFKSFFIKQGELFKQSKDIILFYEKNKISNIDIFFRFLIKNAQTQEFSLLTGTRLKNWLSQEVGKQKLKIEQSAQDELIKFVGNDLWRMSTELEKLASYKKRNKKEQSSFKKGTKKGTRFLIDIEDIRLLVKSKIETDIFTTIDALAEKNKKKVFALIYKHLDKGESVLYLLTMIKYQFRNLLIIKDFIEKQKPYQMILRESRMHPFVIRKTYSQAQKFTLKELMFFYQQLLEIDVEIKTGQKDAQLALDMLIAKI
ncbi:MAG: DNA polymerase III subunit delta [Candidatus Pacebacteria bacterium]|nr:DNA polymerase III subunit delta [Candidatus Paceibacterota bacterium]